MTVVAPPDSARAGLSADVAARPEETSAVAGAGVVESVAEAAGAIGEGDPATIAIKAASAGIDVLGVVVDPFGGLASAGVGWLIEHVSFLREPLDALAGDPRAITAEAAAWAGVATRLSSAATVNAEGLRTVRGWDGAAADAYRAAAHEWTGGLRVAAEEAHTVSGELLDSAANVATVRSTIRDAIADFVGGLVGPALVAAAAAAFTAGTSLLVWVADVVAAAVALARRCVALVQKVIGCLGAAAERLAGVLRRLDGIAARAEEILDGAPGVARWVGENPLRVPDGIEKVEKVAGGTVVGTGLTWLDEQHGAAAAGRG